MTNSNSVNPLKTGEIKLYKVFNNNKKLIDCYIESDDPTLLLVVEKINYRWHEAAKYVANKKFDHSIKTIKEVKKHGEFLCNLFLLIERIVSFERSSDVIGVWKECLSDLVQMEIIDTIEGAGLINNSWKKGYISHLRSDFKALKNNKNPFINKKLTNQIISSYIDLALQYKAQSKPFFDNFWKPFLNSYSAYITDIDKNSKIKRAYIEQNSRGSFYTVKTGKGKSPSSTHKSKIIYLNGD